MKAKPTTETTPTPEQLKAALLKKIETDYGVSAERAAEIHAVMVERNVSPTTAIDLLESAAWHKAIEDGRAANVSPEPKPETPAES